MGSTFGGGLTRITFIKKGSLIEYDFENISKGTNEFSLPDDKLLKLFEDSENNIWIGSYYGGLISIKSDQTKLPFGSIKINYGRCPTSTNPSDRNTVIALTEDKFGNLWIGTSSFMQL